MKRLAFVLLAAAAFAPAAAAKGPSAASISGPGLEHPVAVKGTESSGLLGDLTQYSGFFPAVFAQSPDTMLHARPSSLGPRYTIRYVVPGGAIYHLTQEVYPYARDGAVTYMKHGQMVFGMGTRGGWYRGGADLKQTLVRAGLPRTAPAQPATSGASTLLLGIGIPGAVLLVGAAVLVARRHSSA